MRWCNKTKQRTKLYSGGIYIPPIQDFVPERRQQNLLPYACNLHNNTGDTNFRELWFFFFFYRMTLYGIQRLCNTSTDEYHYPTSCTHHVTFQVLFTIDYRLLKAQSNRVLLSRISCILNSPVEPANVQTWRQKICKRQQMCKHDTSKCANRNKMHQQQMCNVPF